MRTYFSSVYTLFYITDNSRSCRQNTAALKNSWSSNTRSAKNEFNFPSAILIGDHIRACRSLSPARSDLALFFFAILIGCDSSARVNIAQGPSERSVPAEAA